VPDQPIDVVGIGNAIVDILTYATDELLEEHGLLKGSMLLIDEARAIELYGVLGPAVEVSGGSVGNTVAGVASFGGSGAFIGKVRDDEFGTIYRHDIRSLGIRFDVPAATSGPPTARSFIIVTPDAHRTMNTYLGSAGDLDEPDIDPDLIAAAGMTLLEGYLWDMESARRAMRSAIAMARSGEGRVAVTLSDTLCVDRHRDDFTELAAGGADIVFANADELRALYQVDDFEAAVAAVRDAGCPLAFVTRSELGSIVVTADERVEVAADPVARVVDTTGAGDLYAAGALFGLARGLDLESCARLGSLAAAEVISHIGARPACSLRELAVAARLLPG
jgi:sugar/nucleoside kinase (ribokinase family)